MKDRDIIRLMRCLLAWVIGALLCVTAEAQSVRHATVTVVPKPRPVALDGNLQEWDLSGAIDCAYDEMLLPLFSARIALMYDTEALYLGAHLVDDTPMVNAGNPSTALGLGSGDCLQVRLVSDPKAIPPFPTNFDRTCHLTVWQYTAGNQPVLHIDYGMDHHGPKTLTGKDSGVVFKKDPDGKGYTVEGRIPWTLLNSGKTAPKAGNKIPCTVQAVWGDGTGEKTAVVVSDVVKNREPYISQESWGTALFSATGMVPKQVIRNAAELDTPIITRVKLPDALATNVSGAIFSADAGLVRTLDPIIREKNATGAEAEFHWDGADDFGIPLPAGKYTLKLLTHRGIGQQFVSSISTSGNPPYQSDDGKGAWGGDESPAVAAAAAGGRVFLAWPYAEGSVRLVCAEQKVAGKDEPPSVVFRSNSGGNSGGFPCALAADGEHLFVGYDYVSGANGAVACAIRIADPKTGEAISFPFGKREIRLGEWTPNPADTVEKPFFERVKTGDFGPLQFSEGQIYTFNFISMAVRGDLIAASLARQDKILLYNWKTGEKVNDLSVKRPTGLQFDPDGNLVVASGNDLLKLVPATGKMTSIAAGVLDNPWGLALDVEGNIYVSNCGKTMAVKVFSPAGKLIRTIGTMGGRAWEGAYDRNGMLLPAGIAVDGEGKLWVTEWDNSPKRVSVWDKDGKILADYLGPNHPQKSQRAVPWQPERINVSNAEFELNYDTGKWKCLSTLYRPCLTGISPNTGMSAWNAQQQSYTFFKHDGKEYAVCTLYNTMYGVIFRRDGARLKPITSVGNGLGLPLIPQAGSNFGECQMDPVEFLSPDQYKYWYDPVKKKATVLWDVWHEWIDRNGDGLLQKDEYHVEPISWGVYGLTTIRFIDDDMTLWLYSRKLGVIRLPVQSWTADGIPIYPGPKDWKTFLTKVTSAGDEPLLVDAKRNRLYTTDNEGATQIARGKWQAYTCYDLAGKCLWMYRPVWLNFARDAPLWRPGLLIGANTFAGVVDVNEKLGVIAICGYYGNYYLLSSDGLWISQLCYDNRLGPIPGPNVQFIENFTGSFFRHPKNGKAYLLGGDVDCRVWEVTGLETIRTTELPLTIDAASYKLACDAAMKKKGAGGTKAVTPIALVPAANIQPDGDLTEWKMENDSVSVDAGAGRTWKTKLACDEKNLYAAFEVVDSSPMVNAGNDAMLLFKTGDACDVMLAVAPGADPARTKPVAGDMRLLFSVKGDKPVCVVYEAVNPAADPGKAFEFKSPTGQEHFDRVEILDAATVAVKRTANGYTLEAAVPLSAIRFTPKPGVTIRGDVGVLFSAGSAGRTILRSYYANKETSTIEDIPTESRLTPDKWTEITVK